MTDAIARDSTIASIWQKLKNPVKHAENVLIKMRECEQQNGNASVKIGVTGRGYQPCYRVIYKVGNVEHIYGSYWDNHAPLDREDAINNNWSTTLMTTDELDSFLHYNVK